MALGFPLLATVVSAAHAAVAPSLLVNPHKVNGEHLGVSEAFKDLGVLPDHQTKPLLVAFIEPPPCSFPQNLSVALDGLSESSDVVRVNASDVFIEGVVDEAPLLYYVSPDQKQFVRYNGAYDTAAIAAFAKDPLTKNPAAPAQKSIQQPRAVKPHRALPPVHSLRATGRRSNSSVGAPVMLTTSTDLIKHVKEHPERKSFVILFASWCAHCKAMQERATPTAHTPLEALGISVSELGLADSLDMYKIDVGKLSGYAKLDLEWFGFPTRYVPSLHLLRNADLTFLTYDGDLEMSRGFHGVVGMSKVAKWIAESIDSI